MWIKSVFSPQKERWGIRRQGEHDKGIKAHSLISKDTDQAGEAKQTENGGLRGVTYCLTAANSPCFSTFFFFLNMWSFFFFAWKYHQAANKIRGTEHYVSISDRQRWIQQMEAVLYLFTTPNTSVQCLVHQSVLCRLVHFGKHWAIDSAALLAFLYKITPSPL